MHVTSFCNQLHDSTIYSVCQTLLLKLHVFLSKHDFFSACIQRPPSHSRPQQLRDGGPLSLQIKRKIRKFLFPRESDDHLRSSAFHAVNLDGSTHSRNGMFYDRQSESRTVHHLAVTFIYPEKPLEYAIPVFIRDPDPGIFYNQFCAFPQIVYGMVTEPLSLLYFIAFSHKL